MNTPASSIEWGPLTAEGVALVQDVVHRQWNETARRYGAEEIPVRDRTSTSATRFRLLHADTVTQIEAIPWRVKGVLPETGLAAIFGPSGSAKSFLALDLLMAIASGTQWFGRRTRACPVVYVCLEGDAGLSKRVKAYKTRSPDIDRAYFLVQPCALTLPDDVRDLAQAIERSRARRGVIVIDTLNRAAPGVDENSSADMSRVIAAAGHLQSLTAGLVVLVHHTGKDAGKGMRGHSSLFAALDAAIEVRRVGNQREWSVAKSKDGEDGQAHAFSLESVELGTDSEGEQITSCVIRADGETKPSKALTAVQQQGMDAFFAAAAFHPDAADPTHHAHVAEWRDQFNRISTADSVEAKRKAFTRVRTQLVTLGKLTVSDDVYRLPAGFGPVSRQRT